MKKGGRTKREREEGEEEREEKKEEKEEQCGSLKKQLADFNMLP